MKKLGLNWLELLVEHSPTAGGFAEAASTELCKGNVEEIADIELDCTGTYPLAKWNNSRLSLAVKCINVFGFTTFYLCCHPWFSCSSDVFGGCGFTQLFYCYLFLKFLRLIQGENLAWSTVIVPVFWFCRTKWGFSREEILAYCAVVLQPGGCLPPFAAVVAKR